MNFDRGTHEQQNIDSALQQALRNFDSHGIGQPQQGGENGVNVHGDDNNKDAVPIDPSIAQADKDNNNSNNNNGNNHGENNQGDNDGTDFARSTAQAAVRSSQVSVKSRVATGNNTGGRGAGGSDGKVTKPRVNKPGQKFGAKKKSWVWNWFIQDPHDCNLAVCDVCHKAITRLASDKGSPKKLGEHLRTHKILKTTENTTRDGSSLVIHSEEGQHHFFNTLNIAQETYKLQPMAPAPPKETEHEQHQSQQQQGQDSEVPQGLDTSPFEKGPYTQSKFLKQVMRFVVDNKLPLSVVKSESFRQVVYTLKPGAILDLNELNHLYSQLLNGEQQDPVHNVVDADHNGTDHGKHKDVDANVDDQLTNASADWV